MFTHVFATPAPQLHPHNRHCIEAFESANVRKHVRHHSRPELSCCWHPWPTRIAGIFFHGYRLSDVISIILVLARTGVSLEDFVFSLFPRALPFIHALSSWSMHVTALDLNRQIQRFDVLFADGDRVWFDMVPLRQSAQQPVPGWTASVGLQYATISSNWWSVAMAGVGLATPIQAGNGLGYFNVFYGIWASELQRVALDVAVDICRWAVSFRRRMTAMKTVMKLLGASLWWNLSLLFSSHLPFGALPWSSCIATILRWQWQQHPAWPEACPQTPSSKCSWDLRFSLVQHFFVKFAGVRLCKTGKTH